MFRAWRSIFLMLAALVITGCTTPIHPGKSLLLPPQMSADSVVLDVIFVRFPSGSFDANEELWNQIDEQQLSLDLRDRLARNGFRAGIVSGAVPVELSRLLAQTDKPLPDKKMGEPDAKELDTEPRVMGHHLQLLPGKRSDIVASDLYDELPVLVYKNGQIDGETYALAQGVFGLKAFPQSDGCVALELMPELHHGQPKQQYVVNQGMFQWDNSRPRRTFNDLAISMSLSPGAMIVLGSLPNRSGSLGHHFFTTKNDRQEQKLLLVRVSQTQQDVLFSPQKQEPRKTDP